MRSPAEIWFRLRQEIANAWFALRPPTPHAPLAGGRKHFPGPDSIRPHLAGTPLAAEIQELAASILEGRIPLLGHVIETGRDIRWRKDYISGIETEAIYFRKLPYLDASRAGDHKIIWELSRHQHLVTLAQAWVIEPRQEYVDEIARLLTTWWDQNPFCRGMNWASALEVAFRALSWIWIDHLIGAELPATIRQQLFKELYRHGVYLEHNLSVYFSPNTHLLGEAVILHALGVLYPDWPRAEGWQKIGGDVTAAQMDFQVRNDGSHFEQSSAYHIYAVDFFLFHSLLAPVNDLYRHKLTRMVDYLAALCDQDQRIPLLGDDDGGRLFYPYGDRRRFGAATLASCGANSNPQDLLVQALWWIGPTGSKSVPSSNDPVLFRDAGVAVFSRTPVQLIADTLAFGYGGAGHSHAHSLSIVCRHNSQDILFDPGAYTYVANPELRDWFRGTAAHNTVTFRDNANQATPSGPFRWKDFPKTRVRDWFIQDPRFVYLKGECRTAAGTHIRHIAWIEAHRCFAVVDEVSGPAQQHWHSTTIVKESETTYRLSGNAAIHIAGNKGTIEPSWQSEVPGRKVERQCLTVTSSADGVMPALFLLDQQDGIELKAADGSIYFTTPTVTLKFYGSRTRTGLTFTVSPPP